MNNTLEVQILETTYLALKEFAFGWLDKNPSATRQDLVQALLPTQTGQAKGAANAQYVADRAFDAVARSKDLSRQKAESALIL